MDYIECKNCGKLFVPSRHRKVFCSSSCCKKWHNTNPAKRPAKQQHSETFLEATAAAAKAAGMTYGQYLAKQRLQEITDSAPPTPALGYEEKQCVICGATFTPHTPRQITCSPECSAARKEETKRELKKEQKRQIAAAKRAAELDAATVEATILSVIRDHASYDNKMLLSTLSKLFVMRGQAT